MPKRTKGKGDEKTNKRMPRGQLSKRRIPELGYYLIVTDAKETEQNYLHGLRDYMQENLQEDLRGKLVIKVSETETANLVEKALDEASLHGQYRQIWIVFDRDQVKGFDQMVEEAERNDIKVGWSNPCIETWFSAYFGSMPACTDSVACCKEFKDTYSKASAQKYEKSDSKIYSNLCRFGNEQKAFDLADKKLKEHFRNQTAKNHAARPSEMCPATQLHQLVREVKEKLYGYEKENGK